MGQGTLTIYSASAGSGKTYTLTANYLANLFRSRYNYRKILAVTFTNKATAEMKSRILDTLHRLASGVRSDYLPGLMKITGKNEDTIRKEAKEILDSLLHDFSRFSISTIDSFFQKILRAFVREAGLHSGFSIELDHTTILSNAVDEMIESASSDKQLKNWLYTYAMSNIEEEKSWNLKDSIMRLAEELFKEKFKILSAEERSKLEDKDFLLEYIASIKALTGDFEKKLLEYGKRAAEIYSKYGLSDEMFYRNGQGVPGYIKALGSGNIKDPGAITREICNNPPRWSTKEASVQLRNAISDGLELTLLGAIRYYDENIRTYLSADVVRKNIYALGILSDVLRNVHLITTTENTFLLSDAGEVLNLITKEDQSPFIYEKVGNRFENFMIDEFQDTSIIQWNNFKPLIDNSMSEGHDNLIVGDVKQSIYRWRNSDWQILGKVLMNSVDKERVLSEPLTINWRSRTNIIRFNNALFTVVPALVDNLFSVEPEVNFKKLYSEAVQKDPGKKAGGYIRIEFVKDEEERKFTEIIPERLPGIIESLQDNGYKASDIGIIVRTGTEGGQVLNTLIGYNTKHSQEAGFKYNFNAVSDDSLLLSNSPVIIFLIAVISVANDPHDYISRAVMLRYLLFSQGNEDAEKVSLQKETLIEVSRTYFPEGYEHFLDSLNRIPLFEATESTIRFFGLGENPSNIPFLNTFQDYVVSFTGNKNASLQSFLEWWEETGMKKSVILPGKQDAIRILTIHKSKGLEFKAVILPFLCWNLDHLPSKQPVLWVKPDVSPFDELGILPVKYGKVLADTIFSKYYEEEKYSAYLDSINLLYVALTRAKDVLYGFGYHNSEKCGSEKSISGIIRSSFSIPSAGGLFLNENYNTEKDVFEFGEIPQNICDPEEIKITVASEYHVSQAMESLKLKLHGENYFSSESEELRKKINYGKLMHEVFEGINSAADVPAAIRRLVLEGKVAEEESTELEKKINELVSMPGVNEWFQPGNKVMNEAGILLPDGDTRRPDRVIFRNGKTIIIDFKFGEENPHYANQVSRYRKLLADMGYENIEAFIWYVDKNKIETV
jgi:ATP-dependent helicase/nuclease subunit A